MNSKESSISTGIVQGWQNNTSNSNRHHPGYHTLISSSWWCDLCLQDCRNLQAASAATEGHWSEFWRWLGGLLARGTAALLGAAFAIVSYVIGGMAPKQPPITPMQERWHRELKWHLAYRDRILFDIDKYRSDQSRAGADGGRITVGELARAINILQNELAETNLEIKKLRGLLADDRLRPSQWSIPHEFNCR